jgi:hypothetical protein
MKSTKAAAALVWGLAACSNFSEPTGPSTAESSAELTTTLTAYDATAAVVVVADILTRVLPTLTPGAGLASLESRLESLATALLDKQLTALYDRITAVQQALKQYSSGAPEAEEPEIEGIEFALTWVAEGLPAPSGGKKRPGR